MGITVDVLQEPKVDFLTWENSKMETEFLHLLVCGAGRRGGQCLNNPKDKRSKREPYIGRQSLGPMATNSGIQPIFTKLATMIDLVALNNP